MGKIWTPLSHQKKPAKLYCKKCGQEVSWIPIGKVGSSKVWSPICYHCEKPWSSAELKAAQKQIDNRKTIPLEEYQTRNIGKEEFSLPEDDPIAKAFIKATKKNRVFLGGGKNEPRGDKKTARRGKRSSPKRKKAKRTRKATK